MHARGYPHAGWKGWKVVCPNPAAYKILFISFLRLQGGWNEGDLFQLETTG